MSTSSAECLQSIYESTTFVFLNLLTLQRFFGVCPLTAATFARTRQDYTPGLPPPAFFTHARNLEITLSPDFPKHVWCTAVKNADLPATERHQAYDFHWLNLDKFQSLKDIQIWIASR